MEILFENNRIKIVQLNNSLCYWQVILRISRNLEYLNIKYNKQSKYEILHIFYMERLS